MPPGHKKVPLGRLTVTPGHKKVPRGHKKVPRGHKNVPRGGRVDSQCTERWRGSWNSFRKISVTTTTSPAAELFRFIDDLRSEVASLRSIVLELSEEKRSRDEKEKQKQKNRVVFQFNTLPTDIVMDVTYYPYTLTYNGTYGGSSHSHVTSSAPLSRDRGR